MKEEEKPKRKLYVYRKAWYGEKFFCICDEVMTIEDIVVLRQGEEVIAVLPKKYFSCAISINS